MTMCCRHFTTCPCHSTGVPLLPPPPPPCQFCHCETIVFCTYSSANRPAGLVENQDDLRLSSWCHQSWITPRLSISTWQTLSLMDMKPRWLWDDKCQTCHLTIIPMLRLWGQIKKPPFLRGTLHLRLEAECSLFWHNPPRLLVFKIQFASFCFLGLHCKVV